MPLDYSKLSPVDQRYFAWVITCAESIEALRGAEIGRAIGYAMHHGAETAANFCAWLREQRSDLVPEIDSAFSLRTGEAPPAAVSTNSQAPGASPSKQPVNRATADEIATARKEFGADNVDIDVEAPARRAGTEVWVQAWLRVDGAPAQAGA